MYKTGKCERCRNIIKEYPLTYIHKQLKNIILVEPIETSQIVCLNCHYAYVQHLLKIPFKIKFIIKMLYFCTFVDFHKCAFQKRTRG